jgi:hypothetical protein
MDRAYEAVYPFGVPGVPLLILWVKFSPLTRGGQEGFAAVKLAWGYDLS